MRRINLQRKKKFPKKLKIIECDNINITEKDIIEIKAFSDFLYLTRYCCFIFKKGPTYYLIWEEVAYIYMDSN